MCKKYRICILCLVILPIIPLIMTSCGKKADNSRMSGFFSENGVSFDRSAFLKKTEFSANLLTETDQKYMALNAEISDKTDLYVYALTATIDGEPVLPEDFVTVTFAMPEKFTGQNPAVKVYRLSDEWNVVEIGSENSTGVSVTVATFGTFAVAYKTEEKQNETESNSDSEAVEKTADGLDIAEEFRKSGIYLALLGGEKLPEFKSTYELDKRNVLNYLYYTSRGNYGYSDDNRNITISVTALDRMAKKIFGITSDFSKMMPFSGLGFNAQLTSNQIFFEFTDSIDKPLGYLYRGFTTTDNVVYNLEIASTEVVNGGEPEGKRDYDWTVIDGDFIVIKDIYTLKMKHTEDGWQFVSLQK